MTSISFVLKNSNYVPQPPTPPSIGWNVQASSESGDNPMELVADFATESFWTLEVWQDHIWAGTNATGKVWLYGPSTDFTWQYQPAYDFPDIKRVTALKGMGTLYGGLQQDGADGRIYNYVGLWQAKDPFAFNTFANVFILYQSEKYCASAGNAKIRKYNTVTETWDLDFNPQQAFNYRSMAIHDGDLWAVRDPNPKVDVKSGGVWTKSQHAFSESRAGDLVSASDGNLYLPINIAVDSPVYRVYQWNGGSWALVGDNMEGENVRPAVEFNGKLFTASRGDGGGVGGYFNGVHAIDFNNITRGQDNSELSYNLGNDQVFDMVEYRDYIYMCGADSSGKGKVWIYRP
jgi:hypothetical protein